MRWLWFLSGGVFTLAVEWALVIWSDRRDVRRHGQRKSGLIHDEAYEADAVRRERDGG